MSEITRGAERFEAAISQRQVPLPPLLLDGQEPAYCLSTSHERAFVVSAGGSPAYQERHQQAHFWPKRAVVNGLPAWNPNCFRVARPGRSETEKWALQFVFS